MEQKKKTRKLLYWSMQSQNCWQMNFYLSDLENKTKPQKSFSIPTEKKGKWKHMSVWKITS